MKGGELRERERTERATEHSQLELEIARGSKEEGEGGYRQHRGITRE